MEKLWFCLDVGGTEIKAGVIDEQGNQPYIFDDGHTATKQYASQATVRGNLFVDMLGMVLSEMLDCAERFCIDFKVMGIGIAFPGPFDYENGVCLIKGLEKFEALYGINLKCELLRKIRGTGSLSKLCECDILFVNDVEAFAVGASDSKNEAELCVCIGTGCGSSFLEKGRAIKGQRRGVPEKGYIYPIKFLDATIDDYLSKRGLCKITLKSFGRAVEGYELSTLAKNGDEKAIKCFLEFGENIKNALLPIINEFKPSSLILGGQIMKSEELFTQAIRLACEKIGIEIKILKKSSQIAFKGLLYLMKQ